MLRDSMKCSGCVKQREVLRAYGTKCPSLCVCPSSANCDRPRPSANQMDTKENQLGGLKEIHLLFVSACWDWCCPKF